MEKNEYFEEMENQGATQFVEKNSDEEIFPGGPTRKMVEEWKAHYGDIYSTTFDEEVFIWRTLNRTEYKEILKIRNADGMYREERICEKCVLWPIGYSHLQMASGKAGIPSLLAEQIMDKSGFVPLKEEPEKL
jgi:hypothetical protein